MTGLRVDLELGHVDRVRLGLVVEAKAGAARAEQPARRRKEQRRPRRRGRDRAPPGRVVDAERLRQHRERLGVHLLVEQREAMEVERGVVLDGDAGEQLERRLERVDEVGAGRLQVGQRARRRARGGAAGRPRRVVPARRRRAAIEASRGLRRVGALAAPALHVAGDPVLLEPADVAERPERRVELGGERRRQIGRQRSAAPSAAASSALAQRRVWLRASIRASDSSSLPAERRLALSRPDASNSITARAERGGDRRDS